MAVSRRFESRFKISAHRYDSRGDTKAMLGAVSNISADAITRLNIGIPYDPAQGAYAIQYNSTAGYWYFIASNRASYLNSLAPYPPVNTFWSHNTWGRVPYQISWYVGDNPDFILTTSSQGLAGRVVPYSSYTITYLMYLSWYHQVEVVNNTDEDVTIWKRDFNRQNFSEGAVTNLVMNNWTSIVISPNSTQLVTGYQPLEIKVASSSTDEDVWGITLQDGQKYLFLE